MSENCPGSGRRTARFGLNDPDRCPVCDRVAYVCVDGTTGAHKPTVWWLNYAAAEPATRPDGR